MSSSLRLAAFLPVLAPVLYSAPALSDLRIGFVDASPDRFTIRNDSGCDLGPVELAIDLGASPAGLIFDVTGTGAGVAAHASLAVVEGVDQVVSVGRIIDGDSRLVIALDHLSGGGTVRVAVDVDDTQAASELGRTIISGAEIAGALAEVRRGGGPPVSTAFGQDGIAVLALEACIA